MKEKEKKPMVQSTIRVDEELLYEAQYYLSHEKSSVAGFFKEKLREFVADYRKMHPERVPGGAPTQPHVRPRLEEAQQCVARITGAKPDEEPAPCPTT